LEVLDTIFDLGTILVQEDSVRTSAHEGRHHWWQKQVVSANGLGRCDGAVLGVGGVDVQVVDPWQVHDEGHPWWELTASPEQEAVHAGSHQLAVAL